MKASKCRASFAGIQSAASNPLTSPAMRVGNVELSKRVIAPMPERPATRLDQPVSTSLPTGEIRPSPVMTTRRLLIQAF
jgi:hypothetical protein